MSGSDVERSSRTAALSSLPSVALGHHHIAEALDQSPDHGATLDLTHRNLTDVGEDGVEELATIGRGGSLEDECCVLRIALGYNRLTTLPTAFALLSRLRYLNLKNNNFSLFPDVLTVMPSLEILDISRNKIKRLPAQPGSLTNLRVFCISRNKVTKLPLYLTDFSNLNILKVDHNPIEWPPKAIMELLGDSDDPIAMADWIANIREWMDENSNTKAESRKNSDDHFSAEQLALDNSTEHNVKLCSLIPLEDREFDAGVTPHARSFSAGSDASAWPSAGPSTYTAPLRYERPPPLSLRALPAFTESSPSHSPDSYLPTPEESVSSVEDLATLLHSAQSHVRNASYAGGLGNLHRPSLTGKKSLPDLRNSRMTEFTSNSRQPDLPVKDAAARTKFSPSNLDFAIPSPLSHRQDSSSSDGFSQTRIVRPFAQSPLSGSSTPMERPAPPAINAQQNSYFRRLSSMPTAVFSDSLPPSLRCLLETARSILFSLCQVYQALAQYTVYTVDEQVSSVLKKVIDPTNYCMNHLVIALDRFDFMGKKATPSPHVCRTLVECCRDTAAAFGKAVAALSLQLKIIAVHDDVRFLRQLLLIFYGATAEISCAWQSLAVYVDCLKPLLVEQRRRPTVKSHTAPLVLPSPELPASAPPTFSPFSAHASNAPIARSRSTQPGTLGRARTSRRHAGSFSSKDVEIGKILPSYEDPHHPPSHLVINPGIANSVTLRAGLRQAALTPATSNPMPSPLSGGSSAPTSASHVSHGQPSAGTLGAPESSTDHSRQGSQASFTISTPSSSPSVPTKPPPESLKASNVFVDKEAIRAMEVAVEAAPAVWEMMDQIINSAGEVREDHADIQDALMTANFTTERLREEIYDMKKGDHESDRKAFRDDAHVFVKTVVKLSNVIKSYGDTHALFPNLRAKMVKLTNSTEEFVILLHVSSFSPSTTPRSYSPMFATSTPQLGHFNVSNASEDNRLGANLSRSRTTQPSKSSRLAAPPSVPHSALPTRSFTVAVPPSNEDCRNRGAVDEEPS